MQTSERISHWLVYFSGPIGANGVTTVEVSQSQAHQFMEAMKNAAPNATISIVTENQMDPTKARTLYVNPSNVIALEPIG